MEKNNLILDNEKQIGIIVSIGAVALTITPYNEKLCKKWGINKEQFTYLKLHYKNNAKQALNDLLTALKNEKKEDIKE